MLIELISLLLLFMPFAILRLYDDAALTSMISAGDFANPDDEASINGTAGATVTKALWLAVEQTTLGAAVADALTQTITLAAARFADTDYPVIIIGSEKMLITAGFGTTTLTVTRGYGGTTAAAHLINAPVRLAYNCSDIEITCTDTQGTDESGWAGFCADDGGSPDGSWVATYEPADLNYDASHALHRRFVVPASTPGAYKRDLGLSVEARVEEYVAS